MKRRSHQRNNQSGMTMIEILIVAFVSMIFVGGISLVVSEIFKSQKKMQESYEAQSVTNLVTLTLRDAASCTGNFRGVQLPTSEVRSVGLVANSDVDVTQRFLALQTGSTGGDIKPPIDDKNEKTDESNGKFETIGSEAIGASKLSKSVLGKNESDVLSKQQPKPVTVEIDPPVSTTSAAGLFRYREDKNGNYERVSAAPLFDGKTTLGGSTTLKSARLTDITNLGDDWYRVNFILKTSPSAQYVDGREISWPHIRMRADSSGAVVSCSLADKIPTDTVTIALQWPNPEQVAEPAAAGGASALTTNLIISKALPYAVRVYFSVEAASPSAGGATIVKDFTLNGCQGTSCSVVIPANATEVPIPIQVHQDGITESTESFQLRLTSANPEEMNEATATKLMVLEDPINFMITDAVTSPGELAIRCALGTPSSHGPWESLQFIAWENLDTVCEVIVGKRIPTATWGVNNFFGYTAPTGEYPFKVSVQSSDGSADSGATCVDPGAYNGQQCTNGLLTPNFAAQSHLLWTRLMGVMNASAYPGQGTYEGNGRYVFTIPAHHQWYQPFSDGRTVIGTDLFACYPSSTSNNTGPECAHIYIKFLPSSSSGATTTTLDESGGTTTTL